MNEPDPELLEIMQGVYERWTGYQVADVIRVIRQEIERQREADALDAEISALLLKRANVAEKPQT
jgi:uncharacterized protein YjcR